MSLRIYVFPLRTFGPPKTVQSDRGIEFKGAVKTSLKKYRIQNIEPDRIFHNLNEKLDDRTAQGKLN